MDAGSSTASHVPKTIFAVQLINEEFVVEYPETVDNEQFKENLKQFRAVLEKIKAYRYDRAIISQLMETHTQLVIHEPNRKIQELIQELENAPVHLQHQLEAYAYTIGIDGAAETSSSNSASTQGNYILV